MSSDKPFELPMFPLGSVLLPGAILPLHVFEIRYQQMLNHVLEADRRFGSVLITRGFEVGGGETRADIATVATIEDYRRYDDGRAAVVATGSDRVEVVEWLPDDPYPRALVRLLDDDPVTDADAVHLRRAQEQFAELLVLAERLGRLDGTPESTWEDEVDAGTWQLCGRLPISAHDHYSLLSAPSRRDRLARIEALIDGVRTDLELMGGLES